jgi:hypothetical protein
MRPSAGAIEVLAAVHGLPGTGLALGLPLASVPVVATVSLIALDPHPVPSAKLLTRAIAKQ